MIKVYRSDKYEISSYATLFREDYSHEYYIKRYDYETLGISKEDFETLKRIYETYNFEVFNACCRPVWLKHWFETYYDNLFDEKKEQGSMTKILELDEKDICDIVAKYFGTSTKNVTASAVFKTVGYGMAEHTTYVPKVTVRIDIRA